MNKLPYFASLFVVLFVLTNCQQKETPDFKELIKTFNAASPKWSEAIQNNNVDYIINFYDENAIFCPDGENFVRGKKDIAKHWNRAAKLIDDFSYQTLDINGNADLIYETGLAFSTYTLDGHQQTDTSKYLLVWKHIADDEYKILADMFNSL